MPITIGGIQFPDIPALIKRARGGETTTATPMPPPVDFSQFGIRQPSGQVTPWAQPPQPGLPGAPSGPWAPSGQAPQGLQPGYQQYATPPSISPARFAQHAAPTPPEQLGFVGQTLTRGDQWAQGVQLPVTLPPLTRQLFPLTSQVKQTAGATVDVFGKPIAKPLANIGALTLDLFSLPYSAISEPFVAATYKQYLDKDPFKLRYATLEEVEAFRQGAPWWVQLGAGFLLDPTNLIGIGATKAHKAATLRKLAAEAAPDSARAIPLVAVERAMAAEFARSNTLLGKLSPLRLTPAGQQNKLLNEAVDVIDVLTFNSQNPAELLQDFVANPDSASVRQLTGGFSSSTVAKRTAVLLRKAFTPAGATEPDLYAVINLVDKAKGDPLKSADLLARKLNDAVTALVPIKQRSKLVMGRDVVNNYLSIGFMGLNPAYALRNGGNNLVTMLIDGIIPFGWTSAKRAAFLKEWGSVPIASRAGFGPGRAAQTARAPLAPISTLLEPAGATPGALLAGAKARPLETGLIAGQNIERLAAQISVVDVIARTWPKVWAKTLRRLEPELRALGLPAENHELLLRGLRRAKNKDQALAALEAALGGGDLARHPAISLVDALEDAVGPGPAAAILEIVQTPEGARAAKVLVEQAQDTAAVVQQIRTVGTRGAPQSVDELIALFDELRQTNSDFWARYDARNQAVQEATRGFRTEAADVRWAEHWSSVETDTRAVAKAFVDIFESHGDDLGLDAADLGVLRKYYAGQVDDRLARSVALADTWQRSDAAKTAGARDEIWREWAQYRANWQKNRDIADGAFDRGYAALRQKMIDRQQAAPAPSAGTPPAPGAPPTKGKRIYIPPRSWEPPAAPLPRGAPVPPPVPAAPASRFAAMTSEELSDEIARLVNSASTTQSEKRIAALEADITAALAEQQTRLAKKRYTPPRAPWEREMPPGEQPPGWPPRPPDAPPPVPVEPAPLPKPGAPGAAVPAAPPKVTPAQLGELRRLASEQGVSTVSEKGVPSDRHLLAAIKKYGGPEVKKLEDLTPEQLEQTRAALQTRAAEKAAPVVAELEQAAAQQVHPSINVADIMLDPARFQYKLETGAAGTTRQFANLRKWNPALGKGVAVWVDPADGLTYVVNGHHRVELAKRLGAKTIDAPYFIPAQTAAEARLQGALMNIAEGRGTPVDAAKLFRDSGLDMTLLDRNGLAMTESNVRKGLALAGLNDNLFQAVINKRLPIERAVIIGGKIPDHDMQMQLIRTIDKELDRGRKITDDMVSEMADAMVSGPVETFEQVTLFGTETIQQSNFVEKAEFYVYVREQIANAKGTFNFAAKHAEELKRVGNVDPEAAKAISDEAAQMLVLFDTVKNQRGRIQEIADAAAAELAKGGNPNAIKQKYYAQLVEALPEALRGAGARGAADVGAPGAAAARPGLFDEAAAPGLPTGPRPLGADATHPFDPYAARVAATRVAAPIIDQLAAQPSVRVAALEAAHAQAARQFVTERIIPEMLRDKAYVGQFATQAKNFALGDYGARRNINEWLQWVMPYNFWYSFTFPNWGKRVMQNPALLANYARYRRLLRDENERHYRAETGDPNAVLPQYWDREIRLPWAGTDYYLNLERLLNPLMALTEDFQDRTREAAPGGTLVEKLGGSGPSVWAPWIWAYSAWLNANGYQEAAQKWAGYLFPFSRPIKAATALIKEAQPGAPLPLGGTTPEALLGLPNVQGGDIWERKKIPYFLMRLWLEGQIDDTAFENASYAQSGPAWERAAQMEATTRAPYVLGNYLTGLGFRTRDKTEFDIQKMWDEWGALFDQTVGLDKEGKRRAYQAFDDRWPWAAEVKLGRAFDPWDRLSDFAWLVLDRLPPGTAGYQARAALPGLDQWYADGGKFDTWTPEAVQAFRQGLEAVAKQYDVPTPDLVQEFEAAKWANAQKQSIIVAAVQAQGYPLTWELYQQGNRAYFAIPETDKAGRRAFLDANPWLGLAWDANTAVKMQGLEGMNPEQFNVLMQKYYNAGGVSDYAKKRAEAAKLFGVDILTLADQYAALPKDGDARRQWRQQNPDAYARLKPYWDFVYGPQTVTAGTGAPAVYRGGGGGYTRGGGVSQVPPLPAPPATQPLSLENRAAVLDMTPEAYRGAVNAARTRDAAFDNFVALLFGTDILRSAQTYLALDAAGRAAWRAANATLWARLQRYLAWLLGQGQRPTAYSRALPSVPVNAPRPPNAVLSAPLTGGV